MKFLVILLLISTKAMALNTEEKDYTLTKFPENISKNYRSKAKPFLEKMTQTPKVEQRAVIFKQYIKTILEEIEQTVSQDSPENNNRLRFLYNLERVTEIFYESDFSAEKCRRYETRFIYLSNPRAEKIKDLTLTEADEIYLDFLKLMCPTIEY